MPTRYTVVCDDDLSREIQQLAYENDLTEEAVVRQLLEAGVESVEAGDTGPV